MCPSSHLVVVVLVLVRFSSNIEATSNKTICDWLQYPSRCTCKIVSKLSNETRIRCDSLSEISTVDRWSAVPYDRLIFESPRENFVVRRSTFVQLMARTVRFHCKRLFFDRHAFTESLIGQLVITAEYFDFDNENEIFPQTIITKLHLKSLNFVRPISETIFSNMKIHWLLIDSSRFFGFQSEKHLNFLDYDDNSSSNESERTIFLNITFTKLPAFVSILTIRSSIETNNLTENYFPKNFQYEQTKEIELTENRIRFLNGRVFRNLQTFSGRLTFTSNQLESIDVDALVDLNALNSLSLAKNRLTSIPTGVFRQLTQLHELDLSANQIRRLNNFTFHSMKNLRILNFNENPLEIVEAETFENLNQLKEISFQHVNLIDLNQVKNLQWISSLARFHAAESIDVPSELSDLTFCILNKFNQSQSYHSANSTTCSCRTYYFSFSTRHLRLTPRCSSENETVDEQFFLRNFPDQCDYTMKLFQCQQSTTTIPSNRQLLIFTEATSISKLNDIRKLFAVLTIVVLISVFAVICLIFYYRLKSFIRRQRARKVFIEQQRYFHAMAHDSFSSTNNLSLSSTIFSNIDTDLSQALTAPLATFSSTSCVNNGLVNDVVTFIDEDNHAEIDQIVPKDRY